MNTRQKLIIVAAAALLLLMFGILLRPSDPPSPSEVASERSSFIHRRERSPATPSASSSVPRRAKDFRSFAQLVIKEPPKLTAKEIDDYLLARNRSAESLLVAFRMSQDKAFLAEALEKFPDQPQVLLCALQLSEDPAKRLEMLQSFKSAAPDNGIGNCLAARALLDLGRNDEAVAELLQSSGKPIEDFTVKGCQAAEEAYLSAGFSPVEAKMAALYGSTKPTLLQMATPVLRKLDEFRLSHEATGNVTEVQSLRDIQSDIGRGLQENGMIVDSLVGILYEKSAWKGIDSPEAAASLQEIEKRRNALTESATRISALMEGSTVPESEWLLYFDRAKLFGEKAANDWLLEKHPDL